MHLAEGVPPPKLIGFPKTITTTTSPTHFYYYCHEHEQVNTLCDIPAHNPQTLWQHYTIPPFNLAWQFVRGEEEDE